MATRRAAVLGSPVAHSRSPLLHRAAYAALGLDWRYEAIEMTTERLPDFVAACTWPEWAGLSLTMPLKTDVVGLLDEVSETAGLVGAANTVVVSEGGRRGHNTDVGGMQRAIDEAHGGEARVASGIVIGSGATARSALAALARMGAREVEVIARSTERAADLAPLSADLGLRMHVGSWESSAPLDADAVIATVPPGAADALVSRVPVTPGVLLDVAYGAHASLLLSAWQQARGACGDGFDLLLWQAVGQVRLMTGLEPPIEAMRAALEFDVGRSRR